MPEKLVKITGNTYPVKEELKKLGGRWNGEERCWEVPLAAQAEAIDLVKNAPTDNYRSPNRGSGMHGQLWQPCHCGTEPVCTNCERCERHCRC